MNLERYWAKPDKTIQQHINDLLTHLETLKTMGYIDSDDLYELVNNGLYESLLKQKDERIKELENEITKLKNNEDDLK